MISEPRLISANKAERLVASGSAGAKHKSSIGGKHGGGGGGPPNGFDPTFAQTSPVV